MTTTLESRTLSISINRDPDKVYGFISDPENLPIWASAFSKSIEKGEADWLVHTSQGTVNVRFAEKNEYRIFDHYVSLAPGIEIYIPLRVVANGSGCEVVFTLFRLPEMSDENYDNDIYLVEHDLRTLKKVMEV